MRGFGLESGFELSERAVVSREALRSLPFHSLL